MGKINIDELMSHELYRRNQKALNEVTEAQIIKGYEKYGEPLTTANWSGKQLIRHAREEIVDLCHYITALEEKIENLTEKAEFMTNVAKRLQSENDLLKDKLRYIEKYQKAAKK